MASAWKSPKLFIDADPGAVLLDRPGRDLCRGWTNQTEVRVESSDFVQEDSPDEIGQAIADWLRGRGMARSGHRHFQSVACGSVRRHLA
jgi:hypothetical protein